MVGAWLPYRRARNRVWCTDDGAVLSCGSQGTGVHRQCQYEMEVVEALRDVHVVSGYTRYESWQVGMRTMVLTDEGVVLSLGDGKKTPHSGRWRDCVGEDARAARRPG